MIAEHPLISHLRACDPIARTGRVRAVSPTIIEADGPAAPLGALCRISTSEDQLFAEIVSIRDDGVALAPLGAVGSASIGALVTAVSSARLAKTGDGFCGRAIDALAAPLDGGKVIPNPLPWPLDGAPLTPFERTTPSLIFETGIKAVDGLVTLGVGQRIGVFAAAGVGKSTLISQIALQADCDRCVICLVGERGREIEALWGKVRSSPRLSSTTLIASASDQSAGMRVRAVHQALALAEYWRAEGHHVLFLLDSVTRLAMALREIGLAAGEPPTVRAYTPSVFSTLPRLVERCGAGGGGAITAIMTVLAETDDVEDPLSETMRSLLDGHIVLSRLLAEQNCFPAIDVPRSLSRLASGLIDQDHRRAAMHVAKLLSTYDAARTLIDAGIYSRGANRDLDEAIDKREAIMTFLKQADGRPISFGETKSTLIALANPGRLS
jgi:FliI/YscN family ATPase